MKPILTMMIGLPGSGKSTYAKRLAEDTNAVILASDELRKELYGDMNDQEHNAEVFAELHRRCKEFLSKQVNIIYDATNLKTKNRVGFLNELKNIDCYKKAIIIATPYEVCLQNNLARERQVPEEVIKRMRENFHFPLYNEGFDEIEFVWNIGDMQFDVVELLNDADRFDQHNHHHSLSLGEHMWATVCQLPTLTPGDSGLFTAARLHDIGKLETKTFIDRHGNQSDEAHYYQHQYVGAYNAMFYLKQYEPYKFTTEEILHICTLIQYHMHPYIAWKDSEKAKNRDKRLLGEEMFQEVLMLHEADKLAH